jgi:hypothetical protein
MRIANLTILDLLYMRTILRAHILELLRLLTTPSNLPQSTLVTQPMYHYPNNKRASQTQRSSN